MKTARPPIACIECLETIQLESSLQEAGFGFYLEPSLMMMPPE